MDLTRRRMDGYLHSRTVIVYCNASHLDGLTHPAIEKGISMNSRTLFYGAAVLPGFLSLAGLSAQTNSTVLAPKTPVGWNSWDSFGPSVGENEVKANAEVMATKFAKFSWQYVVVDIEWVPTGCARARIYSSWPRDDGQLACERAFQTDTSVGRFAGFEQRSA